MSTTLDKDFLRAVILTVGFRGDAMHSACAALLMIGLRGQDFTGADLPGELTQGSKTLAGCACGYLTAAGLVECVGRIKSPNPDAKGRKVNQLRIPADKVATVKTLLTRWGYLDAIPASQSELTLN